MLSLGRTVHIDTRESLKTITGRKLDNFLSVAQQPRVLKEKPLHLLQQRVNRSPRFKKPMSDRKHVYRSRSSKNMDRKSLVYSNKEEEKPSAVFQNSMRNLSLSLHSKQPRQTKTESYENPTVERVKDLNPSVKKLINVSITKHKKEKEIDSRKRLEKDRETEERNNNFRTANDGIRKRNSKYRKKEKLVHKSAWGVNQQQFKTEQTEEKQAENARAKKKVKAERERVAREGRDRIGLGLYRTLKPKPASSKPQSNLKNSKEPDLTVRRFMSIKKEQTRITALASRLEELLKDSEREKALYSLDKKQRVLPKHRGAKRRKTHRTPKERGPSREAELDTVKVVNLKECIALPRVDLKNRVKELKSKMTVSKKHSAAVAIQRWFRQIKQNLSSKENIYSLSSESEELDQESPRGDLLEQFRKSLSEKHRKLDRMIAKNEEIVKAGLDELEQNEALEKWPLIPALSLASPCDSPNSIFEIISSQNCSPDEEFLASYFEETTVIQGSNVARFPANHHDDWVLDLEELSIHRLKQEKLLKVETEEFKDLDPPSLLFNLMLTYVSGEIEDPHFPPEITVSSPQYTYEAHLKLMELLETDQVVDVTAETAEHMLNTEIIKFLNVASFEIRNNEIDPSIEFIVDLLDALTPALLGDEERLLDLVNTASCVDPLEVLKKLKETGKFNEKLVEVMLFPEHLQYMLKLRNPKNLHVTDVYLGMLFECLCEALNYVKPCSVEGLPPPWSKKSIKILGESSFVHTYTLAKDLMMKWSRMQGGTVAPLTMDIDTENKITNMREDKMSDMLCQDVVDEEHEWIIYEDQELLVSFNLADKALHCLIDELRDILNH